VILLYFTYWIFATLASLTLHLLSLLGHKCSKTNVAMRALPPKTASPRAWFHCASFGEYEQAVPVIQAYISLHPDIPILLTLFSPSAHTPLSKNPPSWLRPNDFITGLPLDTPFHVRSFLKALKHNIVFFASAKYEVWPELIRQLTSYNIPTYVFAAHVPPSATLVKRNINGWFLRKVWSQLSHIFTQDQASSSLLSEFKINSSPLGDPRADRVLQLAANISVPSELRDWKASASLIVAGSTYHVEELALTTLPWSEKLKLLIAPHEVDAPHISEILTLFNATSPTPIASTLTSGDLRTPVIVVDSIGLLTSLYPLADLAVVGGGFGNGIHNVLEPAAHNIRIVTGPNLGRFREASALKEDGVLSVVEKSTDMASVVWEELSRDKPYGKWLTSQSGAAEKIASLLP
jgi:3-deoxy-D-manno-octulosonic-acid transferase